jgi:hypothetical protein
MDVCFLDWSGGSDTCYIIIVPEKITERSVEATIKTLATKDDLLNLRKDLGGDISALRKDFGGDISALRKDMSGDISAIRKEMGENKAENIKWMFIFWIGQVGATLAIVFLFLKK